MTKGIPRFKQPREQHGMSYTPEYRTWTSMNQRCYDKNFRDYQRYGGKGVTVCERWHSFTAFYEDMGPRPEGTSLDRINPYGNYEPNNCRWATHSEQQHNLRETISSMARKCGLKPSRVYRRLENGWDIEYALTVPPNHNLDGLPSGAELARAWGMSRERVRQILNRAGLNGGRRPLDWSYIDKHNLRAYANKVLNIQEQTR
jgi:hypothetical protein